MSTKDDENQEAAADGSSAIDGYNSLEEFIKEGYKVFKQAVQNANALPTGRDYSFYRTHDSYKKITEDQSSLIQDVINKITTNLDIDGSNIRNRTLDEKTELIIEANDIILERVANSIDEINGVRKTEVEPVLFQTVSAQLPVNGSWNRLSNATFSVSSKIVDSAEVTESEKEASSIRLLAAKNVIRPQSFFKDKINNDNVPWEPRIKEKPNSIKPLAIFLEETEFGHQFSHPYELEIEKFEPGDEFLKKEVPKEPKPINETPLIEVADESQLDLLLKDLMTQKVIAVDLEHHNYRSFMGITCLMQISTPDTDYLVDTLELRDKLYVLNEVFTNPKILKIFHGADCDIQWLQRDLSLYVVNLFDTHQAAKILNYSRLSLQYLITKFCNFVPNKVFQLADWRIRPLPDELKVYAREDTHYLIYIYQLLKQDLLKEGHGKDNLLRAVFTASKQICKMRYMKPILKEDSFMDFYRKCKRLFDNRQLYALKHLYNWRDEIARQEDESVGYVLPNHMLLQIAELLPREMQGILACCSRIPPLVRANLLELHKIVLRARQQPVEKAIFKEDAREKGAKKVYKINIDSPLNCPHDLSKNTEFRDDLPILLNDREIIFNMADIANKDFDNEKSNSVCSVFNTPENSDSEENASVNKEKYKIKFLGPYERYKLVKPFLKAEEERLADENTQNASKSETTTAVSDQPVPERIEALRKHFLDLNKKTKPQSLLEMGGTKRKRDDVHNEDDDLIIVEVPNVANIAQNLQTSLPSVSHNKRKTSDSDNGPVNKKKKYRPKPRKNKNNIDNKNVKSEVGTAFDGNQTYPNLDLHLQNIKQSPQSFTKQAKHNTNWQQGVSQNIQQQSSPNKPKPNKNKNKNKNWKNNANNKINQNQHQHPQRPLNRDFHEDTYDYNFVDFKQFQGGAGSAMPSQRGRGQGRGNFKNKNRNQQPKKQNKSMTFGNSQRGGRGRGRGKFN